MEERKLSQDVWKEWWSMKPTEEFMKIIDNRIKDAEKLALQLALNGATKDDTWDAVLAMRGAIMELQNVVATGMDLSEGTYEAE